MNPESPEVVMSISMTKFVDSSGASFVLAKWGANERALFPFGGEDSFATAARTVAAHIGRPAPAVIQKFGRERLAKL
jgi:hypothetical protein